MMYRLELRTRIALFVLVMFVCCLPRRGVAAVDMMAPPSALRGVAVWADGETRVEKLRVRLWNAESESVVYRTRTDNNGMFVIPNVSEGPHYLTVGPVRISIDILQPRAGIVAQTHSIVVVIPKRLPLTPSLASSAVLALPMEPSIANTGGDALPLPEEPTVISP